MSTDYVDLTQPSPDRDSVRRLVPTPRQIEAGDTAEAQVFATASYDVAVARPSWAARTRAYFAAVNPMTIDGPKLPLLMCGMINFILGWDVAAMNIVAPDIQAHFGISVAALATVRSFTSTAAALLGLPMGYLIDRVSRAKLIRTTQATVAATGVVQGLAPSFAMLTMATLGNGVAAVPEQAAIFPYLSDSYPSHARARVFATYAFFGGIGGLVAHPLVGYVVQYWGWRAAYLVLAGISTVTTLVALRAKEPVRGELDRLELGVRADLAAVAEEPPRFAEALKGAWEIKTLRLVSIGFAVFGLVGTLGLVGASVMASKFGLDPLQRSFIGTIGPALSVPMLILGGPVADRLLARRPSALVVAQAAGMFSLAAAFVFMSFVSSLWLFVGLSLVPTVLISLLSPSVAVVQSLVVPARYRGIGLQIGTPFTIGVILVGPVLISTFATGTNLQHVYLAIAPIALAAGFVFLAAGGTVANDMRAAKAAALAKQESEESRRLRANKILVCRDIDVAIDEVQILYRVDLDIREGEIVALVGTNGAGKSTLLRAICGLQQSSNGAIFFDGRDITYLGTHELARMGVVYMPGGQGVFPQMSVRDNLQTAAWMSRTADADPRAEIERVLDFFPRLRERIDVEAGTMSGGEQQMLALGQAFLMKPRLLMIDELSLGLAPAIVEQLLEAIRGMRDEGVTVMLVEQSLNVALTVADRAVFMEKGEIRFDGPTNELLARPDLVRSVFMGGAVSGGAPLGVRRKSTSDEAQERLLECEGLSVSFGGLRVLTDVNLHVGAGEVVGIIGPNGAGKTTLFDVLSGYTEPVAGRVQLGDVDITHMSPDARARLGLGRAFQNARLFPPLTVRENIAVALEKRASRSPILGAVWAPSVRASERKLASRVDGYVELLGLGAYADKFVRELSTGTRRAVEVACQMAAEPKLLLLDEPSSGLAQAETEALGPALLRIVRETGCGMLVIEHDLPLITSISDRLVAMELGVVLTTGTPSEVTTDPRVLASYLAASADVIERSGSRVGSVLASLTETES